MAKGYKTGGRQKGTPNRENPLKGYLREHSLAYFTPGKSGQSKFDKDMEMLVGSDRISAELRLLEFHQPRMKAVDMNMEVDTASESLLDKLRCLTN